MKARLVTTMASVLVCVGAITGVLIQGRYLGKLRDERHRLIAQKKRATQKSSPVPALDIQNRPLTTYRPSLELLRLRGQVAQLMARQRESASVANENKLLRAQLISQSTNLVQLPPGYVRKSQSKMVGLNTPEDTLQTFLWAIHNGDAQKLVEVLSPEAAERFQNRVERAGSVEALIEWFALLPGFRILERQPQPDGSIRLKVEIIPGQPASDQVQLRRINSEWKLDFF